MTEETKSGPLSHTAQYVALKPTGKVYFVSDRNPAFDPLDPSSPDTRGLRMQINRSGLKYWRFDFRYRKVQFTMKLGKFPQVTLSKAREAVVEAKGKLAQGKNPAVMQRGEKAKENAHQAATFEKIARDWHEATYSQKKLETVGSRNHWTENHAKRIWTRIEQYGLPTLGKTPVAEINSRLVRKTIERAQATGNLDVASRVLRDIWAVLNHARHDHELVSYNAADGLSVKLAKPAVTHRPTIPADQLPLLLAELDEYPNRNGGRANPLVPLATKLLLHTLVRSGEVRGAKWSEFDFSAGLWSIPADRMKMRRPHLVPLSPQMIAILIEIKSISGHDDHLFPSKAKGGILSDGTLAKCLRTCGFDGKTKGRDKLVPHGLRSLGATVMSEAIKPAEADQLPEKLFSPDLVESVLAHEIEQSVRKAYVRSRDLLEVRRAAMAWWSNYLDGCQGKPTTDGDNVINLSKRRSA